MSSKKSYLGTYIWFGYMLPFEERLRLIKDAGFDSICSWWGDDFAFMDGKKEKHVKLSANYGLKIEHAHLPYAGSDALWREFLSGHELFEIHKREIINASRCGLDTLIIHPYENVKILQTGNYGIFLNYMHKLAEIAFYSKIQLAFENLEEYELLDKLMQEFSDNSAIGFCFDSGHAHIANPGNYSLLEKYPEKLFALHLHDNDGVRDQHLLPGKGTIDWQNFICSLQATNFTGSLMLEAGYPFDNTEEDGNDAYQEPPILPEKFLKEAIEACVKLAGYARVSKR